MALDKYNSTGLCLCGCGNITPIAKTSRPERGYFKGEHLRYFRPSHSRTHRPTVVEKADHCELHFSNGHVVLVDLGDVELALSHSWHFRVVPTQRGDKYYARSGRGKIYLHKLIHNSSSHVDHANGNTLDNRRVNLRSATVNQNQYNRGSLPNTYSKYKGVTWDKSRGRWLARIRFDGKRLNLGQFKDELEAAKAYKSAAIKFHGEFANVDEFI